MIQVLILILKHTHLGLSLSKLTTRILAQELTMSTLKQLKILAICMLWAPKRECSSLEGAKMSTVYQDQQIMININKLTQRHIPLGQNQRMFITKIQDQELTIPVHNRSKNQAEVM